MGLEIVEELKQDTDIWGAIDFTLQGSEVQILCQRTRKNRK
jgi:hypothetical protein